MSESSTGGGLRQVLVMVTMLGGGGYWYFNQDGLNGVSQLIGRTTDADLLPVRRVQYDEDPFVERRQFETLDSNRDQVYVDPAAGAVGAAGSSTRGSGLPGTALSGNSLSGNQSQPWAGDRSSQADTRTFVANPANDRSPNAPSQSRRLVANDRPETDVFPIRHGSFANITIGSWSLDGFGPTKLANVDVRRYVAKVVRRFDVMAIQQVASIERDVIPRLVDEINRGENRYDFVVGPSTGPAGRGEQLAFIYDTTTIEVDRRGSYSVSDPDNRYLYDPLVAWFRAAAPPSSQAWTFSLVNVRVDLARAAEEVQTLGTLIEAVAADGRGEDDVLVAGLLQADDAYLMPSLGPGTALAVRHRTTDIYDRYQTDNIVINTNRTTEYLGRGGVFNFAREYRLGQNEAEAITSHLPVHGVFTAHEGGEL